MIPFSLNSICKMTYVQAAVLLGLVGQFMPNGADLIPTTRDTGLADRNYRYENFASGIQNEANFKEFCNNLPKLRSDMSRFDAQRWVNNFCRRTGEQSACDTYNKLNAQRLKDVLETIASVKDKNQWKQPETDLMNRVAVYRNDTCISIEEECFITNGLKETLTSDQRHAVWPNKEDCNFGKTDLNPDFSKKSCFAEAKTVKSFERLES